MWWKKDKNGKFIERSPAYHWSSAILSAVVIASFMTFASVLLLSRAHADGGCEFEDIEWVSDPGKECWIYDTFDEEYITNQGWVDVGNPRYCPLPKKITCKGDVTIPYVGLVGFN